MGKSKVIKISKSKLAKLREKSRLAGYRQGQENLKDQVSNAYVKGRQEEATIQELKEGDRYL